MWYQSVSRTTAVCPRNRGIWSGSLPRSLSGMTAKAPPPEASQLTERYSGLTCATHQPQWSRLSAGRLGAYLDQIGVPGISADAQVVVAGVLARRFAKDVAWTWYISNARNSQTPSSGTTHDTWTIERIGQPLLRQCAAKQAARKYTNKRNARRVKIARNMVRNGQ